MGDACAEEFVDGIDIRGTGDILGE